MLLAVFFTSFNFSYAQNSNNLKIKTYSFINHQFTLEENSDSEGRIVENRDDVGKDEYEYWNNLDQVLIRIEVNSDNIKYKPNQFGGFVDEDFSLKITISKNGKITRQFKNDFLLFPKDKNSTGKYYYLILLDENESGRNDGQKLLLKIELFRKNITKPLITKFKKLSFDGGE